MVAHEIEDGFRWWVQGSAEVRHEKGPRFDEVRRGSTRFAMKGSRGPVQFGTK